MATNTITPNMSLTVPTIGLEAGPQYASDINGDLNILDSHNHSPGSGVQITPSGLNINTDLTIQDNYLTNAGAVNLEAQNSSPTLNSSLYSLGVDLYFIDGSGNVIRLTEGGSIVGTAGSIGGLPSGSASVFYSGGVYTFQKATSTSATIDAGTIIIRNETASANGVSLSPVNSLGSSYSIILPVLPPSQEVVTLDNSGNMSTVTYDQVAEGMTIVGANAIGASMGTAGANDIGQAMGTTGANYIGISMNSTGANAIAESMNVTGADAIGSVMSSVGANDIGAAMTSTGANYIGIAMNSTGANAIGASMNSTGANAVASFITSTGATDIANNMSASGASVIISAANLVEFNATPFLHTGGQNYDMALSMYTETSGPLLITRGAVNSSGTPIQGSGFSSSFGSTGVCTITTTHNYSGTPTIVATLNGIGYIASATNSGNSFTVSTWDLGSGTTPNSKQFSFIIIGNF